jgi:hypothetical protein
MSRRHVIACVCGILVLLVCCQGVTAMGYEKKLGSNYNSDVQLQPGDYQAFIVHLEYGDKMMLTVTVGSGDDIDVYTMTSKEYQSYKDPTSVQFRILPEYSKERMKYLKYSNDFAPGEAGDYVVVLDNTQKTASGASGSGVVLASVVLELKLQAPFPWWIVALVVVIAVAAALGVWAYFWRKSKSAEIEEAELQRKRVEAAKVRPIFIQTPQAGPPGAPGAPGPAPMITAPPPSSTCKSCPHVYDPTSANCIACEYR